MSFSETFAVAAASASLACLAAGATAPGEPRLLFHATFDGDAAVAARAAGEAEPVDAANLEWTDGVRGRAVRLSRAAGGLLSYATAGNVAAERGTVSLWARAEWPDDAGRTVYRALFSHRRVPSGRPGTHALMLWWHGQALRGDVSDDGDSWQSSVPAGALDGRWHHYAFSWDPNGMAVYVDGRRVGKGDDANSPLKNAIRAAANGGALYRFSRHAGFDRFYVGSRDDGAQWDGAIDELRVFDAPLAPERIARLAAEFGPPPEPAKPDYAALYRRDGGNPYVGAPAAEPGVFPAGDLELLDEVRLGTPEDIGLLRAAERLRTVGDLGFGEAGGVPYAQLGAKRGSRLALRFSPPDDGAPFFVFDIDYPDDALRTMDCIVQKAKGSVASGGDYAMQCGVAAGGEYPNTGRVLTHRVIWWRSPGDAALVLATARDGAPAAVAAVRLWRVKSGTLPPATPPAAATRDGLPRRSIGLYYEDPALGYGFAVPGGQATPASMGETIDRAVATMRFAGEDMLFYPGAWYDGLIDEAYTPRPHAPDFLSGWYEKFDAEGDVFLVPTLNVNNMPVPPGLVTMDSMTNGALHASPIAIHDTGLPNWGKWHNTPPNFNIAHPEVRRWIAGIVDRLVAQGAPHPSFKGLCLHITRHGLLSWGGAESGYNDYCLDAFAADTGVAVPRDPRDPIRGKAAAEWLRAHPDAWDAWLDWRCRVLAEFWGGVARRMRETRPDLKLWIACYTTSYIGHDYATSPDFVARANREAGIDAALLDAAAPNLVLAQGVVPADWRWRGAWIPAEKRGMQRILCDDERTYALLREAAFPWIAQHDRYWESPIGRGRDASGAAVPTLSCDWLSECGWRVSTVNPAGDNALRAFALPLRHGDVLGMSKGGFLVGTYGMEPRLARFARAFRALPAVRMDEFFRDGAVVARKAVAGGRSWGYVVNTDAGPAEVEIHLPPGAADAATRAALAPGNGPARLSLEPYGLVSFVADPPVEP